MIRTQRQSLLVSRLPSQTCVIPLLFVATIIAAFVVIIMGEAEQPHHDRFSTVPGYFLQDDPATVAEGFDFTKTNFGLIDQVYDTDAAFDSTQSKTLWQRFENKVSQLNYDSESHVQYKVLFLGRHGQGYHNVAESYYGTEAWDCYWSLLDGNETMTWVDAELTPTGITQARSASTFWRHLLTTEGAPAPQSYYASPLRRCLDTAYHTFDALGPILPSDRPFTPTIKEYLREDIGFHTCDRRSSRTFIQERYPRWRLEPGFREDDELWRSDRRESHEAMDVRSQLALDDIFEREERSTWVSISSHSGDISSLLRVLGHRVFGLGTGQAIPVLVRAEKVPGRSPPYTGRPFYTPPTCAEPPPLPAAHTAAAL